MRALKGSGSSKGMILPFQPMALTFHNICYYVPMPAVRAPYNAHFVLPPSPPLLCSASILITVWYVCA